jgi:hypothetical protein
MKAVEPVDRGFQGEFATRASAGARGAKPHRRAPQALEWEEGEILSLGTPAS